MLTFLNAAILVGLAAVAVPLLIHLFTRQRVRMVRFSTLRFLKELQRRQIRRLKLRQILLLIVRMLLVLALVLAFARPALKQTASASLQAGARLTAVIILDNTLSMGLQAEGQRLLDRTKRRALAVVDRLRPGDEIYVLYPQDPPRFAHEGPRYSLESVREIIQATELSYSRTDYTAALGLAHQVLAASNNINKEVYLIGDLQKNGLTLPGNGGTVRWFDDRVRVFVLPVTAAGGQNLTLARVTLANQIFEKGKLLEVRAEVRNPSRTEVSNKLVHLFVEGKRVAQDAVDLRPSSARELVFRMVPDRTGKLAGYVMLEDDDLLEDNRRYFTLNIPEMIAVLLVGGQKADTRYLALAMNPENKGDGRIRAREIAAGQLNRQDLTRYDVVVLSNVPRLDHVQTMKLKNFVEAGGGLMVFLGADVDLRNYNENLHAKLDLPPLTGAVAVSGDQFLSLGKIDFSHVLFRGVFADDRNVISPHFRFAVSLGSTQPVDKIIEFSNGMPFLFETRLGRGRLLYVPTGVSEEASDLVLRSLFVPLVNRGVAYLAGTAVENQMLLVGQDITYYPERGFASAGLEMEGPDGTRSRIKPEVARGKFYIKFNQTQLPGVYTLYNENDVVARWAVNYDAEELQREAFEPDDLEKLVDAASITVIDAESDLSQQLEQARFGRELWKVFAFLALFLVVGEMLLFRETKTKI